MSAFAVMATLLHLTSCRGATFDVRAYGAVGDGKTDDTAAVRRASAALAAAGGGRLLFTSRHTFVTGPFNLSTNAFLEVSGTILGSKDGADWPLIDAGAVWPQFGHGSDCQPGTEACRLMHQALIFAWRATNVSIGGGGTIDGQGKEWWACAQDLDQPPCAGHARPHLLMFSSVSHVTIEDVRFQNSPDWTLHLSSVSGLVVRRTHVVNPRRNAPNSDGIDLDCVQGAVIEDSIFDVGDDALCVKSGIDYFGRRYGHPSRDIVFRNLTIGAGHGISIGSETSGDVYNVTFENMQMGGTDRGPRIKSERGRGGVVDGVVYRNIVAKDVATALSFTLEYSHGIQPTNATATPRLRNVLIQNVTFVDAASAGELVGLPESPIANVTLRDVSYLNRGAPPQWGKCEYASGRCEGTTSICPPCFDPPPAEVAAEAATHDRDYQIGGGQPIVTEHAALRARQESHWLAQLTGRKHVFDVIDFGAIGDGQTDDTAAVRGAIAAVAAAGDGVVYFAAGHVFLLAPFNVTSHCTVYIDANTTLLASTNPHDWPLIPAMPSYGQGKKGGTVRRTSFVHGERLSDVTITGANGTIDGQGALWWHDRPGGYTPGHLIELMWSEHVEISNLTLTNSPFWTVHPVYCRDFVARNLTILNPTSGTKNTDGIDPDSTRDVLIEGCYIQTGDDAIVRARAPLP